MKKFTIILIFFLFSFFSCGDDESRENNAKKPWLCFSANKAYSTISIKIIGNTTIPTLEYSFEGKEWNTFIPGHTTITLKKVGDTVYFRGDNNSFSFDSNNYINFTMTGSVAASGNIMSLLDKKCNRLSVPDSYFIKLFNGCISLTKSPDLPATSLAVACYAFMFAGCANLVTAPDLPATNLQSLCYASMFSNCYNLTSAPNLPATSNMVLGCYSEMFAHCHNLVTAPDLPATNLATLCYAGMFYDCPKLNSITVGFSSWFPSDATDNWVKDVSETGNFYCPLELCGYGDNMIPPGWIIYTY